MSEPNNQIAAELDDALIELSRRKRPVLSQRARKAARIAIIKSAIEKATEKLRERCLDFDAEYEKGYTAGWEACQREEEMSRAAHANERTDDTKRVPDQDEAFENIVTAVLQCQKGTARQFFKSAIEKAVKPWEIQCQSLAKVIQEINASIERNAKHISDPAARTMIDVIGRKASRAAISQTKEKE